jgi:hypothetical protein
MCRCPSVRNCHSYPAVLYLQRNLRIFLLSPPIALLCASLRLHVSWLDVLSRVASSQNARPKTAATDMPTVNTPEDLRALLRLRIMVLALGESGHAGWWKSRFLSPVGLSHLSYLYSRSTFAAAVRGAARAARITHDASIGVGNVFHLFRFPQDVERHLDEALAESEAELRAEFEPLLGRQDALVAALGMLADPQLAERRSVGPLSIGPVANLRDPRTVARLASAYYAAFRDGAKVFPYFTAEKTSQ